MPATLGVFLDHAILTPGATIMPNPFVHMELMSTDPDKVKTFLRQAVRLEAGRHEGRRRHGLHRHPCR